MIACLHHDIMLKPIPLVRKHGDPGGRRGARVFMKSWPMRPSGESSRPFALQAVESSSWEEADRAPTVQPHDPPSPTPRATFSAFSPMEETSAQPSAQPLLTLSRRQALILLQGGGGGGMASGAAFPGAVIKPQLRLSGPPDPDILSCSPALTLFPGPDLDPRP